MAQLSSRRWMVIAIVFGLGFNIILAAMYLRVSVDASGNPHIPDITNVTQMITEETEEMTNEEGWYAQEQGTSVTYIASGYSAVKWTGIAVLILITLAAGIVIMAGLLMSFGVTTGLATGIGLLQFFTGFFILIISIWIYYEVYVVIFKPKSG